MSMRKREKEREREKERKKNGLDDLARCICSVLKHRGFSVKFFESVNSKWSYIFRLLFSS